jgi:hypothetical protein
MRVMQVDAAFVATAPSSARYVPPVGLLFDAHSPSLTPLRICKSDLLERLAASSAPVLRHGIPLSPASLSKEDERQQPAKRRCLPGLTGSL